MFFGNVFIQNIGVFHNNSLHKVMSIKLKYFIGYLFIPDFIPNLLFKPFNQLLFTYYYYTK